MLSKKYLSYAVIILVTVLIGAYLLVIKKDTKPVSPEDLTSQTVQIKFTDKSFKYDSSAFKKESSLSVASFEEDEKWQGDGEADIVAVWDGDMSLLLESKNNAKKEASLAKTSDLSKYSFLKLAVYQKTDPTDLEVFRLYFSNKDKSNGAYYTFTNLNKGWNVLLIPKSKFSPLSGKSTSTFDWGKIEKVGFELASKANSSTTMNIDSLTAFADDAYTSDWLTNNSLMLDLAKDKDGAVHILARNYGASTALLKKLSGLSNFTIQAKLQPMKVAARSGLFIRGDYKTNYGYYFMIDGVNGNRWQIFKISKIDNQTKTTDLKKGTIDNFTVDENKPVYLKVEAKGIAFKYSLSTDGKSFTQLGEVEDSDIKQGGIGIAVYDSGATVFDNFEFSQ